MSNAGFILLALVGGLLLGLIGNAHLPGAAAAMMEVAGPVGALWLNALRMTVIPLVVSLLITGIAQAAQATRAGAVAGRAIIWIVAVMIASSIVGWLATTLFLDIWPLAGDSAAALKATLGAAHEPVPVPPFAEFIVGIVPVNPLAAAANDAVLPLLVFSLFFGFALTRLDTARRDLLVGVFSAFADTLIIIIGWVLKAAPVGVFALAFVLGARAGGAAFSALVHYIVLISAVGGIMTLAAYPVAVLAGRQRLIDYARAVLPVQAVAISTQSSLACLPVMLDKAMALGVREEKAGVVLPMAVALMRATGPAMNLGVAIYVAHIFGIHPAPQQMAMAIIVAMLTSMSAVSLPGQVSFLTSIAPLCIILGAPVEALALLLAVENLPDIMRTLGNAMMDVSVTCAAGRDRPGEETGEATG